MRVNFYLLTSVELWHFPSCHFCAVFIQSHCHSCWKLARCCCWQRLEGTGPALPGPALPSPAQKDVLVSPLCQPGIQGVFTARFMPWQVGSKPASRLCCALGKSLSGLFHESHVLEMRFVTEVTDVSNDLKQGSCSWSLLCLCATATARIILPLYGTVKPLSRFLTDGLGGIPRQVHSCMDWETETEQILNLQNKSVGFCLSPVGLFIRNT